MADETTETEHDETNPDEQGPETGAADGDTTSEPEATTEPAATEHGNEDDGEEDWKAKAELYKAQMRKLDSRSKANHSENQKLKQELEELRAQAAKANGNEDNQNNDKGTNDNNEDPVAARMEQLFQELAEVKQVSQTLAEENAHVKHQQMVAEVAAAKGLTVDQARRLHGDTREELEADADEVIALFGLNQTNKRNPGPAPKPREKRPMRGGSSNPDTSGDGRSREDIFAAVTDTGRRRISK
ncbi:hypothetical protein [Nocardiopsis lucentensis]|uniref:hypothetical protein n=1 Tax=Nocardiopsis lucentensis TaxID=53441 RepID=UPI0003492E7B|nr:hypothetical protein [Nocardiopsis lucentensis]